MHRRACLPFLTALAAAAIAGCGGDDTVSTSSESSSSSSGSGGTGGDLTSIYSPPPDSCAYDCPGVESCAEQTSPYACPSLAPWEATPHAPECGGWDGSYPKGVAGQCTASLPTADAKKRAGPDAADPTGFILPDGRRLHPAGKEWILSDLKGGLTSQVIDVPGTPFVLAVETGVGDHAVRSIDVTKLAAGQDPVVSTVLFTAQETLNAGIALGTSGRVFVSSHDGVIHALSLDLMTGALTRDDASSVALPKSPASGPYVSGVAISPDGTKLVASAVDSQSLLVFSIGQGPSYGTLLGQVDMGAQESFGVYFDPHDPTGAAAYVSLWGDKMVKAIDLADPKAPAIKATYQTDKNPEGIAFLDARYMVVADANGDSVSLVDRLANQVTSVPIDTAPIMLHGGEPCALAFDETAKRLYVALGGLNAVLAYDVDLQKSPPLLSPVGRLGTGWWPSGVVLRSTGDLVVTTLRGHGGGPIPVPFPFGDSDIGFRMHGSVVFMKAPSAADLSLGEATVTADNDVSGRAGAPAVSCPQGVMDFPVPPSNQGGSKVIDHVFFILRENKNFDSILGDLAGVDGEPAYTLKQSTAEMDQIWHNFREAARAFVVSDNYYTSAVFSTQGHVLATYARSSDFNERTWATSGQRQASPRPVPGGGITAAGRPVEGSLFDWLFQHKVPFNILGEIDGAPDLPPGSMPVLDIKYPGVAQNIGLVDLPKACYASGRVRIACDIGNFVYQTLPNDHTLGVSSGRPTPETMCAVNDEATGMMLDAISHSPFWKSSLIFITEDDPSSGGEHVDGHRTPLVVVSPWVKRGYVSKAHIDIASVHKIYAHVFGLPYANIEVKGAMLPYDMFTSTPDYTPFKYTPRTWPLACGMNVASAEEELTELWDFTHEDEQPGLGDQVWRAMRGTPLPALTPEMRARAARWRDDD